MSLRARIRAAFHRHAWRTVGFDHFDLRFAKQHCRGCRRKRWVRRDRGADGRILETLIERQTGIAPACLPNSDAPALAPAGVSVIARVESNARGTHHQAPETQR